ncbi:MULTISPECIES: hypothetical protein [unclassified Bradyrhizobium]|uniref:hypothetical protein n=1 Tax=unclassified Bradyrhizobium TaxID=2631580 RepID=UPI0028E50C11|nr:MULTISPECIES: hypothetical protein [unclassified Bradyrhizobium]
MSRTIPSYFVVLINYGTRGLEAVVDPAIDRAGVVARIVSGEYRDIVSIDYVDRTTGDVADVTTELLAEAIAALEAAA